VDHPLWTKLPRSPGKKEVRYQHLLSGEPDLSTETVDLGITTEAVASPLSSRDQRIENLETTVQALQTELDGLKAAFEEFQKQFQ